MKFSRTSRPHELQGFLAEGTCLTGQLSLSGGLRIDGKLHGSVRAADLLVIGESASIHADIKAVEVQIHGAVYGNVECSRKLEILSTGRLRGDVRTPQFVIEAGGIFEGISRSAGDSGSEDPDGDAEAVSDAAASPEVS